MMLGGVIHLLGTIRARRCGLTSSQQTTPPGSNRRRGRAVCVGHLEAERSRRLQVDELEFGRLRDRGRPPYVAYFSELRRASWQVAQSLRNTRTDV
jgi:hypothetical protein